MTCTPKNNPSLPTLRRDLAEIFDALAIAAVADELEFALELVHEALAPYRAPDGYVAREVLAQCPGARSMGR